MYGDQLPGLRPIFTPAQSLNDVSRARQEREANTKFGDYAAAAIRQDWVLSPEQIAAKLAENNFEADPAYDPFNEQRRAELTAGIPDEYHNQFDKAVSATHALYIRERLMDKMADLRTLGDLGLPGQVGRFALGLFDPANLAQGYGAGVVARLARGGMTIAKGEQAMAAAAKAGSAKDAAAAALQLRDMAAPGAGLRGTVAGVASAFGGGYAMERFRQSVNFEDSQTDAIAAGLMGVLFSAPFVGLEAHEMKRVRDAASSELERFRDIAHAQALGEAEQKAAAARFRDAMDSPDLGEMMGRASEMHDALRKADAFDTRDAQTRAAHKAAWDAIDAEDAKRRAWQEQSIWAAERYKVTPESLQRSLQADEIARTNRIANEGPTLADASMGTPPANPAMAEAFARATAKKVDATPLSALFPAPAGPRPKSEARAAWEARKKERNAVQKADVNKEVVQAPEAVQGEPVVSHEGIGEIVYWPAKDGNVWEGEVVGRTADGRLRVERSDGRTTVINPRDLSYDSPLYKAPEASEIPKGFKAGSVGSAQVGGVGVEKTAMSDFRFDIYAQLNRSENPEIRGLADLMVKDAIQSSQFYAQERSASEHKKLLQRRIGGNFHVEIAGAYEDAMRTLGYNWMKRGLASETDFFEAVGRLRRGDESVLREGRNAEIAGPLKRAADAARKAYDDALAEAQRAGVKGAANVQENANYVNRLWSHENIRNAVASFGEPAVVKLIANAIRVEGKRGDTVLAKNFLDAVMRLEHNHLSLDLLLANRDMGTLRHELDAAGLKRGEINAIIDTLFEKQEARGEADAGNAGPLKFRFSLDEAESLTVDGKEVRLSDLMENDIRVLVDKYLNSMTGHTAMASKGILSRADFQARLKAVEEDHVGNQMQRNGKKYADEVQLLTDMYDHITGRPMSMQTFNTSDRVMSSIRAYSRAAFLGQLGFTAMLELFRAASLATFRAALTQMPAFAQFWRATRAGYKAGGTLADDVRLWLGFSTEHASAYARQHEVTDFTYDRGLTKFENFTNRASHAIDKLSGNNFVTSYTRGLSAAFTVQKYANVARGRKELTEAMKQRMVGNGIHLDDIDAVMADLKAHITEHDGRVDRIRYEEWSKTNPETYNAFTTLMQREVRDAIQDHDIGETWAFQHSSLGKMVTELRAFSIAAHSKQMLKNVHYRDAATAHLFLTSAVTQMVGYMVQTSINFAHDPAELEKRLSADRIAKAAVARMGEFGVLPMFYDSVVSVAAPELRLTGQGVTGNTDNRSFLPPSAMLVSKAISGVQGLGRSVFRGETYTGTDLRNNVQVLPGSNLWGARNFIEFAASGLPKHEPQLHHAP